MTQDIKDVLKLALEFIENSECGTADLEARIKEALRENAMREVQRLGQEIEQEPVVWMYQDKSTHEVRFQKHMRDFVDHGATYETPLYTTPPQRTWVGLSESDRRLINFQWQDGNGTATEIIDLVEAKLKQKNMENT